MYPVMSDIPPDSPHHVSAAPVSNRNRGLLGGLGALLVAAFAYGKYALLILVKVPFLLTAGTALVSVVAYSFLGGPWFAVGLVLMIFVHEMGHVVEIRRQGMAATAPIFIPFLGAAIFQRSHAQSPMRQAQIGIAGPIAGTIGATVAFVLYGQTHWVVLLLWAYYGFLINLFNMIPFGMLDGGWILAPTSKWVQVAGLAARRLYQPAGHHHPDPRTTDGLAALPQPGPGRLPHLGSSGPPNRDGTRMAGAGRLPCILLPADRAHAWPVPSVNSH